MTHSFFQKIHSYLEKESKVLERNKTRCSVQGWPLNGVTLEGKQPQFRAMGSCFRGAWGKFTHATWFQQPRRINIYYLSYKPTRKKKIKSTVTIQPLQWLFQQNLFLKSEQLDRNSWRNVQTLRQPLPTFPSSGANPCLHSDLLKAGEQVGQRLRAVCV